MATAAEPQSDPHNPAIPPPRTNINIEQRVDTVSQGGTIIGVVQVSAETAYDVRGLPNPFLGLQSFTYADRAKYGGRSAEIAAAVTKLTAPEAPQSLLFVTGASGSGKSSFAQAGLLPALVAHYGEATTQWAVF